MLLALALLATQDVLAPLTDDDIDVRVRAEARLLEAGPDAVPSLLRGARASTRELRTRSLQLLGSLSPLAWTNHLHDAEARRTFHGLHGRVLARNWEVKTREFLEIARAEADTLAALIKKADEERQVVFLLGRLRSEDPARIRTADIRWRSDDARRSGPVARLLDGAILVGDPADFGIDRPFCIRLLERLKEDPADAQAAWLTANLTTDAMLRGLYASPERAATEILTRFLALRSDRTPESRFARALARQLDRADWSYLEPASIVAVRHPDALADALRSAYSSPNRWARYFSAAVARRTGSRSLFDPRMFELMREDQPAMREEALHAAFKVAPHDRMRFDVMIDAGARIKGSSSRAVNEFRKIRETALGLALVAALDRHRGYALRILDVFKADARVVDAFCAVVEREAAESHSGEYLRMLVRYAKDARGERAVAAIKALFLKAPVDTGLKASRELATLLGKNGLNYFETHLGNSEATVRTRAIEGLYRVALPLGAEDPARLGVIARLRKHAEGEKDETALNACRERIEILVGERPMTIRGGRRLLWGSGCCSGRRIIMRSFRIGWTPSLPAEISKPEWK